MFLLVINLKNILTIVSKARMGPGKPGKSWNLTVAFSRPGKQSNLFPGLKSPGPGKSLKSVELQ